MRCILRTFESAVGQRADDSGRIAGAGILAIAHSDSCAGALRQMASHVLVGEKNERLDESNANLLRALLPPQQRRKLLRLSIRKDQRIVVSVPSSFMLDNPRHQVACQHSGPALDFYEEKPDWSENE